MNFILNKMNFILKMMNFILNMMNHKVLECWRIHPNLLRLATTEAGFGAIVVDYSLGLRLLQRLIWFSFL